MTCGNRTFGEAGAAVPTMSFFSNLKLSVRLGIAFGALALALAITAAVSFTGLSGVEADAHELSERDVSALMQLVTVSEDFLATDGDVVRHLYLEDGDLKAQDARAEKIAAWHEEATAALAELEPLVESDAGKKTLAEFTAGYKRFAASAGKAVRAVAPGDGRRRRGARRLAHAVHRGTVLKVLERLDVIHDEIEDVDRRAGRTRRPRKRTPPPDRPSARSSS